MIDDGYEDDLDGEIEDYEAARACRNCSGRTPSRGFLVIFDPDPDERVAGP